MKKIKERICKEQKEICKTHKKAGVTCDYCDKEIKDECIHCMSCIDNLYDECCHCGDPI